MKIEGFELNLSEEELNIILNQRVRLNSLHKSKITHWTFCF